MTEVQHHHHAAVTRSCDVAVIGGSAAGLAAALQLARQRRSVLVVDDGTPRNAPAAHLHGYLGRDGTPPTDLLGIGRDEVHAVGGEVLRGRVTAVRATPDDGDARFEVDLTGGHRILARRVLAATGVADELPAIEGLAEHWGRGVVSCPFCHGFELRDRRLVQVVTHPMGLHPTPVWRHLSEHLTVVLHGAEDVDPATVTALEAGAVAVVAGPVRRVVAGPDGPLSGVELADGRVLDADAVLVTTAFRARAEMLAPTGLRTAPHPSGLGDVVEVDPMTGQTAVPGLYAAGNLTDPSLQVLPAAAHGSRVGAMIAFSLADDDLRDRARRSAPETDWDQRYGTDAPIWSANPNGTLVAEATGIRPGRALDVGAGEGADALWLAEQGWTVTASDISGNALARVAAESARRGLDVRCLRVDANDPAAFGDETYDLVSLQYGSFLRTPDRRGLGNLLGAVAVGGTLLVVSHDLTPMRAPIDPDAETRMWDPDAYVGVDEIAAALAEDAGWRVDVHHARPRPPGAISTHHVDDVVLRATRLDPPAG